MSLPFATALVTGGTGFVGRHLVARLLALGTQVTLLQRSDDIPDGAALIQIADFSQAVLEAALVGRRFDTVFHLAAYGVTPTDRDPTQLEEVNVQAPQRLARLASGMGTRAFLMLGSGSEYDFAGVETPIGEDHPLERQAPYGAAKAAGGEAALAIARETGLPLALVRMFNVFGPGESPHRLLPSLTSDLMRDHPVPLSPATQSRDFLFIADAVEALVATARALYAQGGQIVLNLASGQPVTVRAFCETVADQLGKPQTLLQFGALAMRPSETPFFSANPSRLMSFSGWRPRHGLQDGIALSLRQLKAEHP